MATLARILCVLEVFSFHFPHRDVQLHETLCVAHFNIAQEYYQC